MQVKAGDILAKPGQRHRDLLVVLSGRVEIAVPGMAGEEILTVLEAGELPSATNRKGNTMKPKTSALAFFPMNS